MDDKKLDTACVTWRKPPRWSQGELIALLKQILLQESNLDRAYLIGSHARNEAHGDSDVDLILVKKTDLPWLERFREHDAIFQACGAVDLLIYTPEEFEKMRSNPTGFFSHAQETWIQLL